MNEAVIELAIPSGPGNSTEPSLLYFPEGGRDVPLIVALHSWSNDRFHHLPSLPLGRARGWAMLLPDFRGCNLMKNPRCAQACGSPLARQDVVEATEFVLKHYAVDPRRVILYGASGGGHMALMAASCKPDLWCHTDAWCPITDLRKWHAFTNSRGVRNGYVPHLERCLGGSPHASDEVSARYAERSPIRHVEELLKVRSLMLHHGKHDEVVPYSQSVELYQALEERRHPRLYLELFDGVHDVYAKEAFSRFDAILAAV